MVEVAPLIVDTDLVVKNLDRYEKRVGRSFFKDWKLENFPNITLLADGSFFTWAVRLDCIEFGPSVCDLRQVVDIGLEWAKLTDKPYIRCMTVRNPVAFSRYVKGEIKFAAMDDDILVWCIEKEVK
ncbi:hypothetical protein [Veillonella seminalis]